MDETRDILETKAARLGGRELDWNELDFVGWKEFRRMAPAVIGLELSRLERVLAGLAPGSDAYNTLVRARYEMRRFADGLADAEKGEAEHGAEPLRRALLAVSLLAEDHDTLEYVARRLHYVHERLKLIY
ncbi:MAG: hypothetical protein WD021_03235 [Rhodothermales bacterium]